MTCESAQKRIVELGSPDTELSLHAARCEACQSFLALNRSLDEQLAAIYTAPALDPGFRTALRARIRSEKRKAVWDVLPALIAPGAGLATAGICAVFVPENALLFVVAGLVLGSSSYVTHLLFVWLTEELGEG